MLKSKLMFFRRTKIIYRKKQVSEFVIENGILKKYQGSGGNVIIPDGVKRIGEYAFSGCGSLMGVHSRKVWKSIGNHAFWDCSF